MFAIVLTVIILTGILALYSTNKAVDLYKNRLPAIKIVIKENCNQNSLNFQKTYRFNNLLCVAQRVT